MNELKAKLCEFDFALKAIATWTSGGSVDVHRAPLSQSVQWPQSAAVVLGENNMTPVMLQDHEGRPLGVVILARTVADWRSGSPGQTCLRWPFQEFGYHFAPTWNPTLSTSDPRRGLWLDALVELFPTAHLELRRCSPSQELVESKRWKQVEGPCTWDLTVEGDADAWREGMHSRHRRDLAYYRRRIEKAAGTFTDFSEEQDLARIITDCFDLHEKRIQDKGQRSDYLSTQGRHFFTVLANLDREQVRATRLLVDGDIAGACLSFVRRGHYQCFMPGWDPRFRELDLGRQLIYHQILNEFAKTEGDRLRVIDLLGGDLAYKREFGLSPSPTTDLVARPSRTAAVREEVVSGALRLYKKLAKS